MSRRLLIIVGAGLGIRLLVAPFTSWSPDIGVWLTRTRELAHGTPLYQNLTFSYPPLFAHVLALVTTPVTRIVGLDGLSTTMPQLYPLSITTPRALATTITSPVFNVAVKVPAIAADVGIGLALYSLTHEVTASRRRAELVAALWLLNPLAICVTAVVAQFDALPALLTVLAVGHMWRRQWFATGVALSTGALFKVFPAYLLVAAAAFIACDAFAGRHRVATRRKLRSAAIGWLQLAAGTGLPLAIFIPQLLGGLAGTAIFSRSQTTRLGGGLNLWFPDALPSVASAVSPFSDRYQLLLNCLLFSGTGLILLAAALRWTRNRRRVLLATVISLVSLILLCAPITTPQFIIWVLPLIVLGWGVRCGYRPWAIAALSVAPVLAYPALWGGNPLELILPSIAYVHWPVSADQVAASLGGSHQLVGPLGYPVSAWSTTLTAGAAVVALLRVAWPPGLRIRWAGLLTRVRLREAR